MINFVSKEKEDGKIKFIIESDNFIEDRPSIDRWAYRNCTDIVETNVIKGNEIELIFNNKDDSDKFRRWVRRHEDAQEKENKDD